MMLLMRIEEPKKFTYTSFPPSKIFVKSTQTSSRSSRQMLLPRAYNSKQKVAKDTYHLVGMN